MTTRKREAFWARFSDGTLKVSSAHYRMGGPPSHAWLLRMRRRNGSIYEQHGFSKTEAHARNTIEVNARNAKPMPVLYREVAAVLLDSAEQAVLQ